MLTNRMAKQDHLEVIKKISAHSAGRFKRNTKAYSLSPMSKNVHREGVEKTHTPQIGLPVPSYLVLPWHLGSIREE